MKRILGATVIAVLLALTVVMPEPEPPPLPSFTGPVDQDVTASARSSVWYCPWVSSGALRDSSFLLASAVPVDVSLTMPSPIPNEEPDQGSFVMTGPGAQVADVAEIVRRGDTPGFVEFSDGPATAAAMVSADNLLTGDRCIASVPKVWYLPGGTTRDGRTLVIRLFNPFPEDAKVSVDGTSEFGEAGLAELSSIDVPGRSWVDKDLTAIVPFLDDLALTVTTSEGLVIPAMALSGGDDEGSWPGTAPATTWEFPVVNDGNLVPALVVSNPGPSDVTVEIDVNTTSGAVVAAIVADVPRGIPHRFTLEDYGDEPFGLTLRATGAVAATVVAEEAPTVDEAEEAGETEEADAPAPAGDRIAATVGTSQAARSWLAPGPGTLADAETTIWLLNSGEAPATVTLQPLGEGAHPAEKMLVEPGSVLGAPVKYDSSIGGYRIESSTPISVGWSAIAERGIAYFSAVAVDE